MGNGALISNYPGRLSILITTGNKILAEDKMGFKGRIILVILAEIDDYLILEIRRILEITFKRPVEMKFSVQSLGYAFDSKRQQYASPRLISRLRRIKKNQGDVVLGITDVDLYSPDYDFVYGEAEMASGVATLSTYRLKNHQGRQVSLELIKDRLSREAIHELGHLYKLGHCANPDCVMHPCTCVEDVDKSGHKYCDRCRLGGR
jgi:archaemetzincin